MFRALSNTGGQVAVTAHLAGAAFAFLYFQSGWRVSNLFPGNWGNALSKLSLDRLQQRRKLRVHRPADRDEVQTDALDIDDLADQILAKLSREGVDSLTPRERRILDDYSRRVRQRRG
ncbi:MAG: DUF6576 domain-containing protein [Pirellulaceae bacterium]